MKIAAYDITSTSSRVYTSASHITTTAKLLSTTAEPKPSEPTDSGDKATISDQARQALELAQQSRDSATARFSLLGIAKKYDGWSRPSNPDELKLNVLLRFIEQITGKKFNFRSPEVNMQSTAPEFTMNVQGGQPQRMQELHIEQTQMFHEYEAVSYNSSGVVRTADGQEIAFDVSLNMSREYSEYSSVSMTALRNINACDPLVINYSGTAASLTQDKYSFDLLADGVQRNISFAGQGSGFLALDKNGDGTINDGSELFGPSSGNGFGELREYDSDGNGWIDENDDVYSKLTLWAKDEQGNDIYMTLKEADVGAIYLGGIETQFTIGNSMEADGFVRSTSIFLKDSGGAGTVQHIDLVI